MTSQNTTADQARETARKAAGQFGTQQHTDSGIVADGLGTPARTDIVKSMGREHVSKCPTTVYPTNGYPSHPCGSPVKTDPESGESLGKCGLHLSADRRAAAHQSDRKRVMSERRAASAPLKAALAELGITVGTNGEDGYSKEDHYITISASKFGRLLAALQYGTGSGSDRPS